MEPLNFEFQEEVSTYTQTTKVAIWKENPKGSKYPRVKKFFNNAEFVSIYQEEGNNLFRLWRQQLIYTGSLKGLRKFRNEDQNGRAALKDFLTTHFSRAISRSHMSDFKLLVNLLADRPEIKLIITWENQPKLEDHYIGSLTEKLIKEIFVVANWLRNDQLKIKY